MIKVIQQPGEFGKMVSPLSINRILAISVVALACGRFAQAQAFRTFVSTLGNDSNTSLNCSPSAPCRTFTSALNVTNPGGEVVVLTSGGYGPTGITKPVTITAIGVDATITAINEDAITVFTTGNVTLIGLALYGMGNAIAGVFAEEIGILRLYNMRIEGFSGDAVSVLGGGELVVHDSTINHNFGSGIDVENASSNVYVSSTSFDDNSVAVTVYFGQATVTDSSATDNVTAFASFASGTLTLVNDYIINNGTGLIANDGKIYLAYSMIANNTTAITVVGGGSIAGSNPGTTFIAPGQGMVGNLSPPIPLQ